MNVVKQKSFVDHAKFSEEKLKSLTNEGQALFMTEKDAVKCSKFAQQNWWYVPVEAQLQPSIQGLVDKIIREVKGE